MANSLSQDVSAFTIDPSTGALTRIDCGGGAGCNGANFAAGTGPRWVQGTRSGKFVYVTNLGSGDVSAYAVQSQTGALSRVDCGGGAGCNGANFAAGGAIGLAVEPGEKYLYVANGTAIAAFAIDPSSGALARLVCGGGAGCSGSDFAAGSNPVAVAAESSGRIAYVVNHDDGNLGGNVSAFGINPANGALGKIACVGGAGAGCSGGEYASGVAPVSIAVDPSGGFVFVATLATITTGTFSAIAAFRILPLTGALQRISCQLGIGVGCSSNVPENFVVGGNAGSLKSPGVDPSGKFVYVPNGSSVSAYKLIPGDGALDRIDCGSGPGCGGLDFLAGTGPVSIAFDPAGGYAYVANKDSGDVSAFAVDASNGTLSRVDCGGGAGCNGMDFAAGTSPFAIATVGG